jgi:hypothetical protein
MAQKYTLLFASRAYLLQSHHTPHCKTKLDASTFNICKFYMAARTFAQEPFPTYEQEATTLIEKLFILAPLRALHCNHCIHYS